MELGSFFSSIGSFLSQLGRGPAGGTPSTPATFDFPIASVSGLPPLRRPWTAMVSGGVKPVGPPVPPASVPPTEGYWSMGGGIPRLARQPLRVGGIVGPLRVADVTATVPRLSWRPQFPDRIARKDAPRTGLTAVTFTAALAGLDPSRFGWRGVYPDQTRRKPFPATEQFTGILISPSYFPIPNLSWEPYYPDWIAAPRRVRANGQIVLDPNPLPNAAAPALSWQGSYPAFARAAARVADRPYVVEVLKHTPFSPDFVSGMAVAPAWIPRRQAHASAARTVTDRFEIIIPDIRQDWQTYLPDRTARKFVPLISGVFTAAVVERAISPVDWYTGGMTPRLPLRRVPTVQVLPPPPGALILVGQQLAWRSNLPVPVRFRTLFYTGPTMLIPPQIIAGGVGCVELSGSQVTTPQLLSGVVTVPMLTDGAVTSPGLAEGDVC